MTYGLYYKCVTVVIYDRNESGLNYKCVVNYDSSSVPLRLFFASIIVIMIIKVYLIIVNHDSRSITMFIVQATDWVIFLAIWLLLESYNDF